MKSTQYLRDLLESEIKIFVKSKARKTMEAAALCCRWEIHQPHRPAMGIHDEI